MIKIGISSCFMYPDPQRIVFGPKSLNYLEKDMGQYISRQGVLPILIPDIENGLMDEMLSQMDAFILQGGSDLAPETYGETPIGKWKGDAHRDQYELQIVDYAIKNSKPLLGICRGLQLMNVYFGGTLYQDIATQRPKALVHRSAELYDTLKHPIEFVKGSYLDQLYKEEMEPYVNSVHHQAIKELGKDLEVFAVSPDGIIEAVGYGKEPVGKVLGVQWHPEFSETLGSELIDADLLYDAFLKIVKS